jgi:hypothetical protein
MVRLVDAVTVVDEMTVYFVAQIAAGFKYAEP